MAQQERLDRPVRRDFPALRCSSRSKVRLVISARREFVESLERMEHRALKALQVRSDSLVLMVMTER